MRDRLRIGLFGLVLMFGCAARGTAASPGIALSESFDGVTPPALPSHWAAANAQGPAPLWVTDAHNSDTAPNAAHVDDPAVVSDKRLDSPPIVIFTDQAQVQFQQLTSFGVAAGANQTVDGGVLEISIDGAPFQDILDAGGTANYDGLIIGAGNPLEGRSGWTNASFIFRLATANLPAVGGHTVVLRWRMGSSGVPVPNAPQGWWIDSIRICDGNRCNAYPLPKRLDVDPGGNGVWEPGETVDVDPFYFNNFSSTLDLAGTGLSLTGPAGPDYKMVQPNASYGSIAPGALGGCVFTDSCYVLQVTGPRPVAHWDAQFAEALSNGQHVTWALHIGGSFGDVPASSAFYPFVENIFHNRVTAGCGGTNYCPGNATLRKQMAVFVLKAMNGASYTPPPCAGVFTDVPCPGTFTDWIEELHNQGVVAGCGSGNYCPDEPVTRAQMAVFLLRTKEGPGYTPPACASPMFADVPCSSGFAPWINELANRGITAGCGGGNYCPTIPATRGQMAPFLVTTFALRLYGY